MTEPTTPGQAAHDAWCADDDWGQMTAAEREAWEDAARAALDWQATDA